MNTIQYFKNIYVEGVWIPSKWITDNQVKVALRFNKRRIPLSFTDKEIISKNDRHSREIITRESFKEYN